MCGIAGLLDLRAKREPDASVLQAMTDSLVHRGPDESGIHREPGLGLGHRRLSIIDLNGGQQPMSSADGQLVVVYNGEIYNFEALRSELQAAGHIFRSRCDTEVILYAWRQWGERCVAHFRGMFAFALWDRSRETLFLARDRLGIKPLHYTTLADGHFAFASELKAFHAHPRFAPQLDPCAIEDYFGFGYIPDPRTIYKDVRKLEPGHTLTVRRGRQLPEPRLYWDLPQPDIFLRDEAAVTEELDRRLEEAVRIRLVSEVPLGAFLSGGVDSSAVVATMAGLNRAEPVNTCSISFGDASYNESAYAQAVAERFGTRHLVRQVAADDVGLLDRLSAIYDEPFADSSAIPTFRVCELARGQVTVALSGDGGDEGFAGYRRYRWHHYEELARRLVPGPIRRPLFQAVGNAYPKAEWAPRILRAKTTLQGCARDSLEGYFHHVAIIPDTIRAKLFSPDLRAELQDYEAIEVLRRHWQRAPRGHFIPRILYLDFKTYLPGDILTKVDRASMANSLEVRVPLLDHEFVEWAMAIHPELKLKGREGKYIFKKALERRLPQDILYRPKMGFAVPLGRWLRGPLRKTVQAEVVDGQLAQTGLFDMSYLHTLVNQHLSGEHDHAQSLWALLMFAAFCRRQHL